MLKPSKSHILILFIFLYGQTHAQFGFEFDGSIPVKKGGITLDNAWGGGLNYVQVSDFDYDFDGDMDLFLFDRSNSNLRVFTQEDDGNGPYYKLAYNAVENFPADIRYRATMVDYDNDGRKDLWTYHLSGLRVYRNVGDLTNGLQWTVAEEFLYSELPNGPSQVFVNASDIPAIIDVDYDGDIDILSFAQNGKYVEYHQNQSMELYGVPDSLVYELKNECWGKFSEDFSTNVLTLNDPDSPCSGGSSIPNPLRTEQPIQKHAGSTLLALDIDNSGVMDLVIGDVSFTSLSLVINDGLDPNTNSAMGSQDNSFPSNTTPVDIQLFPAAYYVDVDFDNVKDLVVAPNARNVSENETSVLYYKNLGTDNLPNFVYIAKDLFQNQMIEHGTGSVPIFSDLDEDGLEDLFIANYYRYKPVLEKESTIAYYKNTGTVNNPEYTYVDYNFLNLDQENFGLRSIPAFGDLDNDGDDDILLGIADGTLAYYQNNSIGAGAVYATPSINYQDFSGTTIDVNNYAHPQLFDLDNDGLLDLLIGQKTGEILFYKNIGTLTTPSFQLTNSQLGGLDISAAVPNAHPAPHFFRVNGETKLFVGSYEGELIYYDSIDNNLGVNDSFFLVSPHYIGIDVEAYSSFAVNDVDDDGNLDLFVGQDLGGLYHFEADPNSNVSIKEIESSHVVALFPNPTNAFFTISSSTFQIERYTVMGLNGQRMLEEKTSGLSQQINISTLSNGMYIVMIELENGIQVSKKLIKK